MFSGNESPFGGAPGAGGPFNGGGDFGPPPADGIFDSAFESVEDLSADDLLIDASAREREHMFLAVGLHFFLGMKGM